MEVRISYRQVESTPAVEDRIKLKASKLKKFFHGKMYVDWTCSVEGDDHQSDVTVRGDNFEVHASAANSNMYKSFDEVTERLEKQIQKKNEQVKEKIHRK